MTLFSTLPTKGSPEALKVGNPADASGRSWRQLGRFFAAMLTTGLVLNGLWEMAQMSGYAETAGRSWTQTLGLCTRTAVGDLGVILGIYAVGALAAGDLLWGLRGRWNVYATAAVLGLAQAVLMERAALAAGRWSYSERMPVVDRVGVGLWPLVQMTLLSPLTFWIARRWADRNGKRSAS